MMAAVQHAGIARSAPNPRPQTPLNQLNDGVSGLKSPPGSGVENYFHPPKPTRTNSIYSLSRASFTHQLSQLTSLSLPDSASLSSTVAAIPTAPAATTALRNAATQIQKWIQKASEVLGGLDADDDVEWAAAGGRDGLEDVDSSIVKFQRLVNAYVEAIEQLQQRRDIGDVPKKEFKSALDTLDDVIASWSNVSKLLKEVKRQVELALEWEELWNTVLGEIRLEIEDLSKLIFEMEEKRHQAKTEQSPVDLSPNLDVSELETIVEEEGATSTPGGSSGTPQRFGLPPQLFGASPLHSPNIIERSSDQEHSSLMELFARMEPLKASIDFLPMRLSSYRQRAESVLPTACDELDGQRQHLEKKFRELQKDAEKVQKELGEDRWVATFRNVGKQAQKMCVTVERGIVRMHEAFENGSSGTVSKKIGEYKEKKNYYGPAIQKILTIITGGMQGMTTKNGEILAISTDTKNAWHKLEARIKEADAALQSYQALKSPGHMRDSVSSVMSHDLSATESAIETPGSSPASSVILAPTSKPNGSKRSSMPSTPEIASANSRRNSLRSSSGSRPPTQRRSGSSTTTVNSPSGSALSKRLSYVPSISRLQSQSPSPSTRVSSRQGSSTPTPSASRPVGKPVPITERPKWNSGTRVDYKSFDSPYKQLALANGNPNTRSLNGQTLHSGRTSRTASASLPHPSPLWRESSASPAPLRKLGPRPASSLAFASAPMHSRRAPSPSPPKPQRNSVLPSTRKNTGTSTSTVSSTPRGVAATNKPAPKSSIAPKTSTAPKNSTASKNSTTQKPSSSTKTSAAPPAKKSETPSIADVKAHERHYTPTTPTAAPRSRAPNTAPRSSLLPIASAYGVPTISSPTDSEFAVDVSVSDGRPAPSSDGRPATALGTTRSRRSSLLPVPTFLP